jgi:nucleoside-diphosphate-sugar epimerase
MKILITGINGFVGTNFTNSWFRRSHTIYGLDILLTVTENAVISVNKNSDYTKK